MPTGGRLNQEEPGPCLHAGYCPEGVYHMPMFMMFFLTDNYWMWFAPLRQNLAAPLNRNKNFYNIL